MNRTNRIKRAVLKQGDARVAREPDPCRRQTSVEATRKNFRSEDPNVEPRVRLLYLRVENLVPLDARYFIVGGFGAVVTLPMRCILALPEKARQHLAAFAVGNGQGPVEQHTTSFPAGSPSARRLHI